MSVFENWFRYDPMVTLVLYFSETLQTKKIRFILSKYCVTGTLQIRSCMDKQGRNHQSFNKHEIIKDLVEENL